MSHRSALAVSILAAACGHGPSGSHDDASPGADGQVDAGVDGGVRITAQQAYIKASNTGGGDELGMSVALSADGATLAVGAYSEASAATGIDGNQADNSATAAGAVYVYTRTGTIWSQEAYVKAS